jgi:cytochrome P450
MHSVYIALLSFVVFLVYRVVQWRLRLARVRRTMPAVGVISEPWAIWRRFWPKKWQAYNNEWQFQQRKSFDSHGSDILPLICLFGKDVYYLFDADAIVEASMDAVRFPKDLVLYRRPKLFLTDVVEVLNIYGRNILTTEGQEWRLHRKITSRPFSEKNNQLVHEETVRQTTQMMASWESKAENGTVRVDSYIPLQSN